MRVDRDIWSGTFFMALGTLGLHFGSEYAFGTTARMGPGFLPSLLCWSLVGLGLIIFLIGLARNGDPMDKWHMRPLIMILLAILAFAGLIETMGLVPATIGMTLVAAAGSVDTRWIETCIVALTLAAGAVVIFVKALGLTMKILPGTM